MDYIKKKIPPHIWSKARAQALLNNQTITEFITRAIEHELRHYEQLTKNSDPK